MKNKKIVLIGAGNVAHHLAPALLKAGMNLCQIYSRTLESARELGRKTGITYTSDLFAVYPDCDIYIFCVSDDALLPLYKGIRMHKEALIVHTSGSIPMEIFSTMAMHYGVLYPLQTFSKKRSLDFKEVPLCLEASDPAARKELYELARAVSGHVREISSATRKKLHLAAVFANNFTNQLYTIARGLLEEEELDFDMLRPLIFETAHKVMLMPPEEAQTGPAKRGDESIVNMHKGMLKHRKKLLNLYTMMTESIREKYAKPEPGSAPADSQMSLNLW